MTFFNEALKNLSSVGTLVPSSKTFARVVSEYADLGPDDVVVEIGPGTGAITGRLLDRIGRDGAYLGIEINESFAVLLRSRFPGADIVRGSAEHIGRYLRERGHQACDRIISGIPWTNLHPSLQRTLLGAISGALRDDGRFLTYGYFPLNYLPRGRSFKRLLRDTFSEVREVRILANLPPSYIYLCRK